MIFINYLPKHILKNYDKDLKKLFNMLLHMSKTTADKLIVITQLLHKPNSTKVKSIVEGDRDINNMEHNINQCVLNILALRRPLAEDLRWTLFALKTASDIELIADHIKKIAQYSHAVFTHKEKNFLIEKLIKMAEHVHNMLQQVILNPKIHAQQLSVVIKSDVEINNWYSEVLKHLFTNFKQADNQNLNSDINIIFLAKNIELIGDTIVHIAEYMYAILTGIDLEDIDEI